ncbi:hypothetical protein HBI22_225530 [Parastagonospora nodorum]|nr:hypothetical protein HBI12_214070 [Parastagonospora nodorum]KAH5397963.1 hypothetical protein HBI47_209740 [Parastagonospora nodorum]KAH5466174.1 hypothetical protein HBI28_216480 [Parastagonospora nodorum]KAH5619246.1 hypothetical protein HBI22_225530 [Parastagonospora nodorum]KAH6191961.1 hypothetical protein HBI53_216170 [Parastagonospora nodorum]
MSFSVHLPRPLRRRPVRQALLLALVLLALFDASQILHYQSSITAETAPAPRSSERIYIASIHWNNEKILRSHWNDAVVELAKELGKENVFVTVYESGSWDETKSVLSELDDKLEAHNIRRNITLSNTTHVDELSIAEEKKTAGWLDTASGKMLRRIPYLSRLRNWSVDPLLELSRQGQKFDKVLFLNDVVFSTQDVLRLLNTNNGDYAAACSLDFSRPPQFYDTFALQDTEGHRMLMQTWPYFRAKESRQAMLASFPTPVASCWNGMVVMPAEPFVSGKLRFRGIPDSLAALHLEGSECCLIHVDNPLHTAQKRTYVNPQVRVGYSGEAYEAVHPQAILRSFFRTYAAVWENRIRRWTTSPRTAEWKVRSRLHAWRRRTEEEEAGEVCIVDEMQVLADNGWAHV